MSYANKFFFILIGIIFLLCFWATDTYAITLLTQREALKRIFSKTDEIQTENKTLDANSYNKIKQRLGGKLVNYTHGAKAKEITSQNKFTFYFGIRDNKKIGVALILIEPGKWGPIKYIISLDLDGKIKKILVMSYTETRGRPIARKSFLSQFKGKTLKDPFELGQDIVAVSGATISSEATSFIAKKALVLYDELLK